ncbi:MAG: hypothetical protein N2037_08205 [Acidimicrobiales bacterium]|nr:hypothetical protein [Acidimicrobiales bacterium]
MVLRWIVVALWMMLPLIAGPAFADALHDRGRLAQQIDSVGLWLVWVCTLVALLVPSTVSLTLIRVVTPAAAAATAVAAASGQLDAIDLAGLAGALAAAVLGLSSPVAHVFVNGSAYGDERRFLLRPPGALLLGPIQAAWCILVTAAVSGPVLLGERAWALGAVATGIGWPVTFILTRAFHGLSRRWFVFVPAGVVVHDYSSLTESVMAQRRQIDRIAPAAPGTTPDGLLDLSGGAPGIAIDLWFNEHLPVSRRPPRRPGTGAVVESTSAAGVRITPALPGLLLDEARRRRLPTG